MKHLTNSVSVESSCLAIYPIKTYLSIHGSLMPISEFTQELYNSLKPDSNISCDKYIFNLFSGRQYDVSNSNHSNIDSTWVKDEFSPPYDIWITETINSTSSLLQLYAVCLPVARGLSKNANTTNIFNILYYAHKTYWQLVTEVHHTFGEEYPSDSCVIELNLKKLPEFPLVNIFEKFQKEHGYKLQQQYGHTFKQIRRRGEQSPPQSQYHYWENPAVYEEAHRLLQHYVRQNYEDAKQYALILDAKALASYYLEILDKELEQKLRKAILRINSITGDVELIAEDIDTALYIWLFAQIHAHTDFRVCKMCQRVFIAGSL